MAPRILHSVRSMALAGTALATLAACQPVESSTQQAPLVEGRTDTASRSQSDTIMGHRALGSRDLGVAKSAYGSALRKDPSNVAAALGLAETHLALGEIAAARQIFETLARKAPQESARVNQGRGLVALYSGQANEAVTLLGNSVQQDDSLWRAWLGLGQAHDRLGQSAAARRAFNAAERTAPAQASVLNDIGMSYITEKNPAQALDFFQRALVMDPSFEIARGNIRIARAMTGNYDDAIAGTPAKQLPDVLNNVGYIAILNRDFDVADRYLRRALEVSPVYHEAAVANLDLLDRMSSATPTGPQLASRDENPAVAEAATIRRDQTPPKLPKAVPAHNPTPTVAAKRPPLVQSLDTADITQQPPTEQPVQIATTQVDRTFKWQAPQAVEAPAVQQPAAQPQVLADLTPAVSADRKFSWDSSDPEEKQNSVSVPSVTNIETSPLIDEVIETAGIPAKEKAPRIQTSKLPAPLKARQTIAVPAAEVQEDQATEPGLTADARGAAPRTAAPPRGQRQFRWDDGRTEPAPVLDNQETDTETFTWTD